MSAVTFTKMEGTGNDYVYFDGLGAPSPALSPGQIARISDRHFGVGGDGVVIVAPSKRAAASMLMWNADGSSSAMCGNALRCVALLVHRRSGEREFVLESGSGLHNVKILNVNSDGGSAVVQIDMGIPAFNAEQIPFLPRYAASPPNGPPFIETPFDWEGSRMSATLVSMGNPHCVFFVEDPETFPVLRAGPYFEQHRAFPERANIEFVSVRKDGTLAQRTYERGSGETLSCGSGACAVLVASVLTGRGPSRNTIHLRGGDLELEWKGTAATSGPVLLTGPARIVFVGETTI